jgi:hypothetical protein
MVTIYKILLLLLSGFIIIGCGSTDSDDLKNEFVSLSKRANYEYGWMQIDERRSRLSYSGILAVKNKETKVYTDFLGLAVFDEENEMPRIIMSTDDGEMPNFEMMIINDPDTNSSYECNSITYEEKKSQVIRGYEVIYAHAKECIETINNTKASKNIEMKLTQSMFLGGTSRIDIDGDMAYLNTEYYLKDDFYLLGGLGTRTYNQIFDLIQSHPKITTIVEQNISGSIHDDINMKTGRLIRKHGLFTHLQSRSDIASGGVDLFCSGLKRTMENGAKLGVHSWSGDGVEAGELPVDSPLHDDQIAYFNDMLGEPMGEEFYFFTINAASSDDIHEMSTHEIEYYHLLTNLKEK